MAASTGRGDPLLRAARLILTIIMAISVIATVTFAIGATALAIHPEGVLRWLSAESGRAISRSAAQPVMEIFMLLIAMGLLSVCAQWLLRRVIDSVALGDPFVPDNALRLNQMAWLTLVIQVLAIPAAAIAGSMAYFTGPFGSRFGFSLGGVLLALVLFILASVFRQGAKMREELEGTV